MSKSIGQRIAMQFTEKITNSPEGITYNGFPSIVASATGTHEYENLTIDIPGTPEVGDLILVFLVTDYKYTTPSISNMTRVYFDGYNHKMGIYKTTYTGEFTSVTTTSLAGRGAYIIVVIPEADIDIVVQGKSSGSGKSQYPDPDPIISGFDPDTPTLWIAWASAYYRYTRYYPSNFPLNNMRRNYTNKSSVAIAALQSTNPSEDANQFQLTGSYYNTTGTLAIRFKSRADINADQLKKGLSVSGNEHKYIGGPLISRTYPIISSEVHPDHEDKKHLLLTIDMDDRFNNVVGDLTIDYDSSKGFLRGSGGELEDFSLTFTPQDLIPVDDPHAGEEVIVNVSELVADFVEVTRTGMYEDETVTASADLTFVFTETGVVNP